ncbi:MULTISPECIES: GntR family transcriptional regulator [unclassified Beijerinckia]|uniref:GntR family transcriptional regulator n=1 Tax=unclassified Beijerinckia TaxID=2638183 RepID=UPI0008997E89|nr:MULTISPECIES: GntR family transcriptional regulator [unclassified Beijerinckia]MDH7796964.1 GntR family transcriptional regulator [Beijerinckia sp. GAS462]SEC66826.1 GntR family transcriptional regulator [Beijerinckia sp. 28-YEA-48]
MSSTATRPSSTAEALKKSSVARYIQLATLFRRRIETGEWSVGAKMPTVEELAQECGVATMTIRQALDILESDGLIERYRAKGTFVRERPAQDLWCQVQTDWSGMLIARDNARIEVLFDERNVQLPPGHRQLGRLATSYRHLRRRHTRDDEAFLLADVYVSERICSLIPEEAYSTKTAMRLVADIPGIEITDATQTLTIGMADLMTSTILNIPLSHPIAKVERCAVDGEGELVIVANGIYRGDKVRVDLKLR